MVRTELKKKIKEMSHRELATAADGIVIAWNFIRIRERQGLTQERAAELGGVTVGYVGKLETAAVSFGTRAQQKWSRIFNVDRTEFLTRPDIGIRVIGVVMDKGVVRHHESDEDGGVEHVPLPPGYTQEKAEREGMTCLKVLTDALHPHLRKDSYLYVNRMPISVIRDDNLVIYAEDGEAASVKEVELLPKGRILLKGLGRGGTITKEISELPTVEKIVFIGM
jgi:transcriptional regulator with XRE-family HTH domain